MKRFVWLYWGILVLVASFVLHSCYFSKKLDRKVVLHVKESFLLNIENSGTSSFCTQHTRDELGSVFLNQLEDELRSSGFILSANDPEYILTINALDIQESTTTETIQEENSPEFGVTFELTTLEMTASGSIEDMVHFQEHDWTADKWKEEKLKKSKKKGVYNSGVEYNYNTYYEKEFDREIVYKMAGQMGRRSGVRIAKRVKELLEDEV